MAHTPPGLLRMFYRMFQRNGADPGGEFRAAMEECDRRGIPLVLGDRDVRITMQKLKESVRIVDLVKMLGRSMNTSNLTDDEREVLKSFVPGENIEQTAERLKTRRHVQAFVSVARRNFPDMAKILIEERDEYLCNSILKAPGKRVVAVVGMAHLEGIARNWDRKT